MVGLIRFDGFWAGRAASPLAFDVFAGAVQASASPWAGWNINYAADADMVVIIPGWEGTSVTADSATLGGVAMTAVTSSEANSSSNGEHTKAFYLLAADMPAGGSDRLITVTFSASVAGYGKAWSFKNAQQIAPIPIINTAAASSLALTRTGATAGSILVAGIQTNDGSNVHANSGFDNEDFTNGSAGGGQYGSGVRHGPVTAGNYTNTTTLSGGSEQMAGTLLEIFA